MMISKNYLTQFTKNIIKGGLLLLLTLLFTCVDLDFGNLYSDNPEAAITSPGPGDIVYPGETCRISWQNISGDFLQIDLYKGDTFCRTVAGKAANSGSFDWTVTAEIINNDYNIRMEIIDSPPYRGEACPAAGPFCIDRKWQELPPLEVLECSYTAIAMGENDYPAVVYSDRSNAESANQPCLAVWNGTAWDHSPGPFAAGSMQYYSVTAGPGNSFFVYYVDDQYRGFVKQWTGSTWQDYGCFHDFDILAGYWVFGVSLAVLPGGYPVVSFLTVSFTDLVTLITAQGTTAEFPDYYCIASRWNGTQWQFVEEIKCRTGSPTQIDEKSDGVINNVGIIGLTFPEKKSFIYSTLPPIPSEYAYIPLDLDRELYTSLVADGNGELYLAYTAYDSSNTIRLYAAQHTDAGWQWSKEPLSGGEARFPSIASAVANQPIVVYKDNSAGGRARVLKFQDDAWMDYGFAGAMAQGYPSIAVAPDGAPLVATDEGIARWNGATWEFLGFPCTREKGSGYGSWWIAAGTHAVAVVYTTPENRNSVRVKLRELP